jgi:LacI family transcriptional regulator
MLTLEHFCCQELSCPDYGVRGKENLSVRGWSGQGQRIRMLFCRTCKTRFSERKGTILEQARLPDEKSIALLEHIREGCGTRSTSRLLRVGKDTVTRYIRRAGKHAAKLHDELVAFSPSDPRGATRREVGIRRQEGGALYSR